MRSIKIIVVLLIVLCMASLYGCFPKEKQPEGSKGDNPRCFFIEGQLHFFYGKKIVTIPEGKELGATLVAYTGSINILPTKEGETNFIEAIGCKCILVEEQVYIQIDGEWYETISDDTFRKMSEEAKEKASREVESMSRK